MSPLLSMDSLMVFGIETKETLLVCFFFLGLSWREEERERCLRRLPAAAELARVDSLAVESVTVVTVRARSGEDAGAGVTYGRISVATRPCG